jgi:hypothetical protein
VGGSALGRRTDAPAASARPRAPVDCDARIERSEVAAGDRPEGGGRQQLREPDGNLTTLAPHFVAAILDETLPPDVTLFAIAVDPPALWKERRGRVD